MSGQKDGQTLFHRVLPATAKRLTSTTAVDWHFKAQNKKCNVGLIKNYCIQGTIKKKSASGSRTLPCLLIFFEILFCSENAKNGL